MKDAPKGWPRISSAVFYDDAKAGIDFLCKAFGFEVRLLVEGADGSVQHSQLVYGDGLIMVASVSGRKVCRSPRSVGGVNTQSLMAYVDDVDAHCEHARAAGATIESEPKTDDYGEGYWVDRGYECVDPEGHHWWFVQRLRG